jgi:acyl-CoA reductase-like NAD-dependent aldehyde dehydrogenase
MNLTELSKNEWHQRAAKLRYETRHFIDGRYVDSVAGGRFKVVNPATAQVLCEVSAGAAADVDLAVAAAKRAFASKVWSR